MSTDMVLFAKGAAATASRAKWTARCPLRSGSTASRPRKWTLSASTATGSSASRLPKTGEPPVIFTKDVVSGMMRTDGTPLEDSRGPHPHLESRRRAARSRQGSAGRRRPACASPAIKLRPIDQSAQSTTGQKNVGVMRPVQAPVKKPEYQPGYNPDGVPRAATPAGCSPCAGRKQSPATPPANRLMRPEPDQRSAIHVNWSQRVPLLPAQFHCIAKQRQTAPLKPSPRRMCAETPP